MAIFPSLLPSRRSSRFFWGAGTAFLLASVLLIVSKGMFARQSIVGDFTLRPDQYGDAVTLPDTFEIPPGAGPLTVLFDAPVDQSWVFMECQLVLPSRQVANDFSIQLAHYHGVRDGRQWIVGSPTGSKTVPSPGSGLYLLRLKAAAGYGNETMSDHGDSGPPVHLRIQSGMRTVRLMTWATTVSGLLGCALFLRGFTPPPWQSASPTSELKPRFLFLDGLRGVAVLAVLVCHFFVPELSLTARFLDTALSPFVGNLARHGNLGVEIFFVLSGFVIAHTLGDRPVTPRFAARFIARRAVRLDPPYYVALGLMLAVVAAYRYDGLFGAWRDFGGWSAAISNLFYLQDLLKHRTPLDISWTLCLEIQFYLTLIALRVIVSPLFRPGAGMKDHSGTVLLLLVLFLMLMSLACWYPAMSRFDFPGTWFRFALGVITYLAYRRRIDRVWWTIPMVVLLGLSVWFHDLRGMVTAATAGLILFAGLTGRFGTWLSNRPIQFVGKLSYSIYLVHLASGIELSNVLWGWVEPTPAHAVVLLVMGIATAIGGALLMYHLFEKPGIAISHRLK